MRITSLELHNFRCFTHFQLEFTSPITLITGPNGAGKTALLEALHYACYLRSFRTATPKELIQHNASAHQVQVTLSSDPVSLDTITIGYTPPKRTVKINNKSIHAFKELYALYRVVTLTEDTLMIIKGSPSIRRNYIDQMVTLFDPAYAQELSRYRRILDNRNALLSNYTGDSTLYNLWTEQLWQASRVLQQKRRALLFDLQQELSTLVQIIEPYNNTRALELIYHPYKPDSYSNSAEFLAQFPQLYKRELHMQRTLFGAHLDDFECLLNTTASRIYASRGQQKLITVLLVLAQIRLLHQRHLPAVLLLDDFLTDLDNKRVVQLLSLALPLASQTIITSPFESSFIEDYLTTCLDASTSAQIIHL